MSDDGDLTHDLTQGQAAYRILLDDIRKGALLPGARLRETDLASQMGISRTPVREAIRLLEADGLVTHLPRQGATLRSLDYAEVIELYEMRVVLEATAARLAARAASDLEIAELLALNADLAASPPGPVSQDLNRQFHRTVIDAARNRFLVKAMRGMQKTLLILGPTTLDNPTRAQQAVAEHGAIATAIAARDGLAAEAAMRAHIEAAMTVRIRLMRARAAALDDDA
jgi:DNA-binding GntR family transcriptional regulator